VSWNSFVLSNDPRNPISNIGTKIIASKVHFPGPKNSMSANSVAAKTTITIAAINTGCRWYVFIFLNNLYFLVLYAEMRTRMYNRIDSNDMINVLMSISLLFLLSTL
jgi:hypothetical protein